MHAIQPASEGRGNLVPVTGRYLVENLAALGDNAVRVYQGLKNSEGELRAEPVDPTSALSLAEGDRDKKLFLVDKDWKKKLFQASDPFEGELESLIDKTPEEKAQAVHALKARLADLKVQGADPQVIMETVSQTFLLNKSALKPKSLDVGPHERALAKDTESIVGTALGMAEDPTLVAGLFAGFQGLSNGQTVNHVLRVFTSYTAFLLYYNRMHQTGLGGLVRKSFVPVYRAQYAKLLPHLEPHLLTSDHLLQLPALGVFEMKEYSLGAFLHDIGKMGNIDYFESDAGYEVSQIQQHVFLGAGLILMNYTNDHEGARLMAGDHHNALGHPGGYGVTRMEREKGMRAPVETVRCLSSDPAGFVSGQALGWLPTEMLAVVDVYDAMTDTSRTYKKAMTPAEATVFLDEKMAGQGKADPILVDLYIDFLRSQAIEVPADRGFAFKAHQG